MRPSCRACPSTDGGCLSFVSERAGSFSPRWVVGTRPAIHVVKELASLGGLDWLGLGLVHRYVYVCKESHVCGCCT